MILLGTSAPLLTRLSGNPSQVQNTFYNRTTTPAALLIALLAALVPFVSWKGGTWRELLTNARRSLLVAAAGVLLAFLLGAREPTSLGILFVALFAADMNLRAVIRKARNGKLGGAGGYVAHTGIGIMLAGIVISGVYAKSTRVTLPIGKRVQVGQNALTFLRVLPGTATEKQMMEVQIDAPKGKTFYVYPKMYLNSRTNQLMANPAIRNGFAADYYVAPQSYDPGQPELVGREIRLAKGTTQNIDGIGFTFRDFNADRSAMMRGEQKILVLTEVTITPPDGSKHDATIHYTWHMDTREADAEELDIPGVTGGKNDRPRGFTKRRLGGAPAAWRVEGPGRRVPGGDHGIALRRRDGQAAHQPGLGRLLRPDGGRDARPREAFPGGSEGSHRGIAGTVLCARAGSRSHGPRRSGAFTLTALVSSVEGRAQDRPGSRPAPHGLGSSEHEYDSPMTSPFWFVATM